MRLTTVEESEVLLEKLKDHWGDSGALQKERGREDTVQNMNTRAEHEHCEAAEQELRTDGGCYNSRCRQPDAGSSSTLKGVSAMFEGLRFLQP